MHMSKLMKPNLTLLMWRNLTLLWSHKVMKLKLS